MKKCLLSLGSLAGISAIVFAVVFLASWAMPEPSPSGIGTRTYLVQDVSDTITANTTPAATDLTTTIAASQKVHIRFYVPVSLSGTASGVKFLVDAPGSPTTYITSVVLFTDSDSIGLSRTVLTETALGVTLANAGDHWAVIDVTLYNGATAGSVTLSVAQNVSDAGTVIVRKGAYADVTKF